MISDYVIFHFYIFLLNFITTEFILQSPMHEDSPIMYKSEKGEWKTANCDECLHKHLGDRVNIEWNFKSGCLRIEKSHQEQNSPITYQKGEGNEILKNVHFRHSEQCPILLEKIKNNPTKTMKPCSCVLLYNRNKKQFLITQRTGTISFPHAWVLPGGHLEKDQGIFEGGIRECEEEVGLPHQPEKNIPITNQYVMVWESFNDVDGKVRSGALVIFFVAECEEFEIKVAEKEVGGYKWKKVSDNTDEQLYDPILKKGYARGHKAFLKIIREQNPHL